jgi:hypothetical protein
VAVRPSRVRDARRTSTAVEGLWANLKGVELANRACGSLEELAAAA